MADASPESIQRLIENSEKGLSQIEASLPYILERRQAVEDAIKKQGGGNEVLDLQLIVLDLLLAENEVIYDISASLDALLRASDDYTRRFYMQSLNLCFWESCQLFVGAREDDQYGLLSRIELLTKQMNQAGCQLLIRHIIDDIQAFRSDYANKGLRDITRHYDDPITMYEKLKVLDDIDIFARGASQLIAIRMEVSLIRSFLWNLLAPFKIEEHQKDVVKKKNYDFKGIINEAVFKAFKEKNVKKEIQKVLAQGNSSLDECYRLRQTFRMAVSFLNEKGYDIPDGFEKMEAIILLRMETLYLKYDIACSIWGYLNASSEKERSQNLRMIHITKQAALTHLYGYNDKTRENSLWAKIKAIEEAGSIILKTEEVEKSLMDLVANLNGDKENSRMFTHYRFNQVFYIPARLDAFGKMVHYKELCDSVRLLNVCKMLEGYTMNLLYCIDRKQKQETKRKHDEWMGRLDDMATKLGNNEKAMESIESLREMVEVAYGNKAGKLLK